MDKEQNNKKATTLEAEFDAEIHGEILDQVTIDSFMIENPTSSEEVVKKELNRIKRLEESKIAKE